MWQPLLKASDSSTFWHEHMYFILALICTSDTAEHTELRYCFSIHHLFSPAFGNSALHSLHCYNDIDESQGTETHETVFPRHKNQDICVICVQKHNCIHTRAILASKLAQSYSLKQRWKQEAKGTKLLEHTHKHMLCWKFPQWLRFLFLWGLKWASSPKISTFSHGSNKNYTNCSQMN